MKKKDIERFDWNKVSGLLPVIVQDERSMQVLMLGYMNREALEKTIAEGKVTFFSRTRQSLWTKGETSGHFLNVRSIHPDCDNDTLLIRAQATGPICHTGTASCFEGDESAPVVFLNHLADLVHQRNQDRPDGSYTTTLFESGKSRIAQKVGEEGVELALARMEDDRRKIVDEASDLLFHMMVLLEDAGIGFDEVCRNLSARHKDKG